MIPARSMVATSSSEEQATCTKELVPALRVGPNLVDGLLGVLKSQTQREEVVTVARIDEVEEVFHAIPVDRESSRPPTAV
jgi:hypothetical protein